MSQTVLFKRPAKAEPCVTLIGMAGSGKSTIGHALARHMHYAFVDTDHMIEACYGTSLQNISETLEGRHFLDMEARFICSLRAGRCVIATGGSVVYRDAAMQHLKNLGPVVCLEAGLAVIQRRIAMNPKRGLVIAPGQTIADLYNERSELYNRYADLHCAATRPPDVCAEWIASHLPWNSQEQPASGQAADSAAP